MSTQLLTATAVSFLALIFAELLLGRVVEKYVAVPGGWRHALAISTAALLFVAVAVFAQGNEWQKDDRFEYFVRVEAADTQLALPGAQLELAMPGRPPETAVSDNSGLARFRLLQSLNNSPAEITIRAIDCDAYRQSVTVRADELPLTILLACNQ